MALWFSSRASLYSTQASGTIKCEAHSRQTLEVFKHQSSYGRSPSNIQLSRNAQLAGERLHLVTKNALIKNSTKRSGAVVFASMPSLVPAAVQVASRLFTFGTAFVVPFYTVMILAPHASWTKKLTESSIPYVVLGVLYVYLVALSWSPETLPLMFASKYWLPELPGITRMFSSTLTVASAWLHLLAVDLFAGRQIYLDGLQNDMETRHSLVLCLLFCPVGMLSHFITKAVIQLWRKAKSGEVANVAKLYS